MGDQMRDWSDCAAEQRIVSMNANKELESHIRQAARIRTIRSSALFVRADGLTRSVFE